MKHKIRQPFGWVSRQLGAKLGIGIITIVPFAATVWILYEIFTRIDGLLQPVIKAIWGSTIPAAGTGSMRAVIIEFPRKGMKAIGFVTNELCDESGKKLFCVFIPNAPNPTSGGFMEIVEESEIVRTSISIENAFKTIFSAGKLVPDEVANYLFPSGKATAH